MGPRGAACTRCVPATVTHITASRSRVHAHTHARAHVSRSHARSHSSVLVHSLCVHSHVHAGSRACTFMHRQLCSVDQAPLDPSSTTAAAGPAPGTLAVGSGPGGSDRLRVKGPVRLVGRSLCLSLRLDNHPVARGDREEGDNPLPVSETQVSLGRVRHFSKHLAGRGPRKPLLTIHAKHPI